MIITFDWLKDHLKTNLKEKNLLEQLTNIGLEVESVESLSGDNELFKVAEIIKTEKHPNADRLKVCDVNIGENEIKKVVCGAENAKEGLLTIYAPPGAIIPKTKTKLVVAKIRGVTSYGMLCSESELNISDESDGIIELSSESLFVPVLTFLPIGNSLFVLAPLPSIDTLSFLGNERSALSLITCVFKLPGIIGEL